MSLIYRLFSIINWFVAVLLIFSGAVLALAVILNIVVVTPIVKDLNTATTVALLNIAIILSIVGVIISPPIGDLIATKFHTPISFHTKVIIILAALVIITVSISQSRDQQLGTMIAAYLSSGKLSAEQSKASEQQNVRPLNETLIPQLQNLSNLGNYQEVIRVGEQYAEFDATVKKLVKDAIDNRRQQEIELALQQGPQLLKEGEYYKAYELTNKLSDNPELKQIAEEAKIKREEIFEKIKSLYEKGKYDNALAQGILFSDYDCRIKQLLNAADQAKIRKKELAEINAVSKTLARLMRARQYEKAYEIAKNYKDPSLQELANRAKLELDEAAEKKILARLKTLSSSNPQALVEEYAKLVNLFPDNQEYRDKLTYYRAHLAKSRTDANRISKKDYGEKWPFTIASAELSCTPPGIVTLWANDKTYALNSDAGSRGYAKIAEILKEPQADTIFFITKGLALCQ